MHADFLDSTTKIFRLYEHLGRRTIERLEPDEIFREPAPESNSVGVVVQHMHGNMLSRFTDFLTSDGEKPWRDRDREFEVVPRSKDEVLAAWDEGWRCLFDAIEALGPEDVERTITIRGQEHTVLEALHRQLSHYAYHVGQLVYVGKMMKGAEWETLSVAKGASAAFNAQMLAREDRGGHFTDAFVESDEDRTDRR